MIVFSLVMLLVIIVVVFDNLGINKLVVLLVLLLGVIINMDGMVIYLGFVVFFVV